MHSTVTMVRFTMKKYSVGAVDLKAVVHYVSIALKFKWDNERIQ
jgi:hypothetical protein